MKLNIIERRRLRANALRSLEQDQFDCYRDYFFSLHMNSLVSTTHAVGTLIGVLLIPFVIYFKSWSLFGIYIFLVWGVGFLSHVLYDGFFPVRELVNGRENLKLAVEMNLKVLSGKFHREEERLLLKYPFLVEIYAPIADSALAPTGE